MGGCTQRVVSCYQRPMTAERALKSINTVLSSPRRPRWKDAESITTHHYINQLYPPPAATLQQQGELFLWTINMRFTYISLAALGFVASVMALPAPEDERSLIERNVCWCTCATKPNGYCEVGKDCGRECEDQFPKRTVYNVYA